MTITKAELIAVVNKTLKRGYATDGTALDEQITSALVDLSERGDFLQDEFLRATIEDRDYYSLPDNCKKLLHVGMKSSDNVTIYKSLKYETWEEYKLGIYGSSTSETPTRYTWMSGFMYPRPIPDDIYNMYWWYSYIHPESSVVDEVTVKACDNIEFADRYRKAIELRLLYEVAEGLDLDKAAKKYNALYVLDKIPSLIVQLPKHANIIPYRDGF